MPIATETLPARPTDARRETSGGIVLGFVVGLLAVLVGLLPWLVTGARLPLQNLWTQQTLPDDMPRALLPVSQYHVSTIAALLIVGGAVAGLAAGVLARRGRTTPTAVLLGVATGAVVATWQAFAVLRDGLGLTGIADRRAAVYWMGMLVGTIAAAVLALVAGRLLSRSTVTPVALGLVLVAVPLGSWAGVWLSTVGGPGGAPTWTGQVVRWLPAALVAGALGWCGLQSAGRVAVWVVGAFVLWAAPLLITAATSALGTRAFRGDPRQTIDQGLGVLRSAAASGVTVAPVVAALVAALVLVGIRTAVRRG
jgi:hypothetical protein